MACNTLTGTPTLTAVDGITCLSACPTGQALSATGATNCVSACAAGSVKTGNPSACTACSGATPIANLAGTTCVASCPTWQIIGTVIRIQ